MRKLFIFIALTIAFSSWGFARDFDYDRGRDHMGGCLNRNQIMIQAHRLEQKARHFHRQVHSFSGYSHLANDAHKLANSTRHFHRQAESYSSCSHLQNDFFRVEQDFRHLKRQFNFSHNRFHNWHLQHDFQELAQSFRALNRIMNNNHERDYDHDHDYGRYPNRGRWNNHR